MEQSEKVEKGLECCIKRQPYTCGEMCPYHDDAICVMKLRQDALDLIRQQQERIKELEAAIASWQKFAPFLHAHGLLNDMEDGGGVSEN